MVAFLGTIQDAITAVRRQLALRGASAVGAVQDAIVALLGAILDTVAAVRGEDAARCAGTVVSSIELCPIVALLGRFDLAIATSAGLAASSRAIGII